MLNATQWISMTAGGNLLRYYDEMGNAARKFFTEEWSNILLYPGLNGQCSGNPPAWSPEECMCYIDANDEVFTRYFKELNFGVCQNNNNGIPPYIESKPFVYPINFKYQLPFAEKSFEENIILKEPGY